MTIRELQDLPASLFYGSQLVTDAGNFLCRFFFLSEVKCVATRHPLKGPMSDKSEFWVVCE